VFGAPWESAGQTVEPTLCWEHFLRLLFHSGARSIQFCLMGESDRPPSNPPPPFISFDTFVDGLLWLWVWHRVTLCGASWPWPYQPPGSNSWCCDYRWVLSSPFFPSLTLCIAQQGVSRNHSGVLATMLLKRNSLLIRWLVTTKVIFWHFDCFLSGRSLKPSLFYLDPPPHLLYFTAGSTFPDWGQQLRCACFSPELVCVMWVAEGTVPSGHCLMHSHTWGCGTCLADSKRQPAGTSLPTSCCSKRCFCASLSETIYLLVAVCSISKLSWCGSCCGNDVTYKLKLLTVFVRGGKTVNLCIWA
jgi:hypothetical protein